MAKKTLGTAAFSGLDVSKAAHLIDDSSLSVAKNTWTDKQGELSVARGGSLLYSGYSAISCFSSGRQGGSDTLLWMDGDDVVVDGSSVGTITAGSDMYSRDFDDNFYIMGSTDEKNYIYDGSVLRQHGAWDNDNVVNNFITVEDLAGTSHEMALTAITNATSGEVTTGITHLLSVGDIVYFSGISGMTELNGILYSVASIVSSTVFTIDQDTSTFGTFSATGTPLVYSEVCGLTGIYSYYLTLTVKFADGAVIESNPKAIYDNRKEERVNEIVFDLLPTQRVRLHVSGDFEDEFVISGTIGVDYFPGLRVYRTKESGSDFYLEEEGFYGDTGYNYSIGGALSLDLDYANSQTSDTGLGSVFLYGLFDHTNPPPASLMSLVGQRLFMNDVNNPKRLYFTGLDGIDYVPTLNYLNFPDVIEGIGSVGSVCVVFSCDRMWRVSMLGGIPDVDEIKTSVGTTHGRVMTTTDRGLLFLREDGLWATNGSSPPIKVSEQAFSEIDTPNFITAYGDVLMLGGLYAAYIMVQRLGQTYWHEYSIPYHRSDATNGKFYAASLTAVYELLGGSKGTAELQTKDFIYYGNQQTPGQPHEFEAIRVVIDYKGDDIPQVWVNGNRDSDYNGHPDEGTDREGNRRLLRFSIPRLMNHVFNIKVTMSGNGVFYGCWLETE